MPRSSSLIALMMLIASFLLVGCGGGGGGGGGNNTNLPATIRLLTDPRGYELEGGRIQLVIQENTVAAPVNVAVTAATNVPNDANFVVGSGVTFGPATLLKPVSLRLRYNPANLPAGANENNLRLVKFEGDQWVLVNNSTVNPSTDRVFGDVSSFGTFGIRVVNPT